MFCTRCGLQVDEGIRFCRNCGQEAGRPAPAPLVAGSAPPPPGIAPGQVSPPHAYGGFWVRAVALLIDTLILGIPVVFVVMVLIFFLGGFALMARHASGLAGNPANSGDPRAAMAFLGPLIAGYIFFMIFLVAVEWLYFAIMESSERQATFGKAAMSIRVTDLEGRRLTFGHATGRFFAKIITGLIPLAIGYIMAGFTAKKQALHDMIAGMLVLRK